MHIRDVPGDGNCFFHAVSLSLRTAGIQAITGPEIRAQLIQHLETPNMDQNYMRFLPLPDSI